MSLPRQIPDVTLVPDNETRRIMESYSEVFRIAYGETGNTDDRVITRKGLIDLGLVFEDERKDLAKDPSIVNATAQTSTLLTVPFTAASGRAVATYDSGVVIPNNSYVVRSWYDVIDAFTSASSTAQVAIGIKTDDVDGIKAAAVVTADYTVGLHEGIQDGTVANFSTKATGDRQVQFDVTVESLTGGRLNLFLEVVTSE